MYLNTEWDGSKTAAGVVVSDGTHAFVIHPDEESILPPMTKWSNNITIEIPGVSSITDNTVLQNDFAGKENTAAILAAVTNGTIIDAPIVQYCTSITFAHGKTGYLPSTGELALAYTMIDDINDCLNTINGDRLDMKFHEYWSSTQRGYEDAWYWDPNDQCFLVKDKNWDCGVRVVSTL